MTDCCQDSARFILLKDWAQLAKSVYIVDTQLKDAKQGRRMAISILLSTLKPEFICIEKDETPSRCFGFQMELVGPIKEATVIDSLGSSITCG